LNLVTRLRGGSPKRKGLASPSPRQQELRDELAKLEFRKEEAIKGEDYDQAKAIKAEMDELEAQLAACQPTEGSPKRLKSPSTIHHELRDELATLRCKKEGAIKGEDYDQAKAIKAEIDKLEVQLALLQSKEAVATEEATREINRLTAELEGLEASKAHAVQKEEFDEAKRIKAQCDGIKAQIGKMQQGVVPPTVDGSLCAAKQLATIAPPQCHGDELTWHEAFGTGLGSSGHYRRIPFTHRDSFEEFFDVALLDAFLTSHIGQAKDGSAVKIYDCLRPKANEFFARMQSDFPWVTTVKITDHVATKIPSGAEVKVGEDRLIVKITFGCGFRQAGCLVEWDHRWYLCIKDNQLVAKVVETLNTKLSVIHVHVHGFQTASYRQRQPKKHTSWRRLHRH